MRTIKFRAISEFRGDGWVYGDLRHYNRNEHTEKWTIHVSETGLETDIDETTIGQFTGLFDKNGKEIYEGDIVKYLTYERGRKIFVVGVVEFYKCCYELRTDGRGVKHLLSGFDDNRKQRFEVIGNVFDNLELINRNNINIK